MEDTLLQTEMMDLYAPENQTISELFGQMRKELRQVKEGVQILQITIIENMEKIFSKFEEEEIQKKMEFETPPLVFQLNYDNDKSVLEEVGFEMEGLILLAGTSGLLEEKGFETTSWVAGVKQQAATDKPREIFLLQNGEREELSFHLRFLLILELHLLKPQGKLDDHPMVDKFLKAYREWKRYKKKEI